MISVERGLAVVVQQIPVTALTIREQKSTQAMASERNSGGLEARPAASRDAAVRVNPEAGQFGEDLSWMIPQKIAHDGS